MNVLPYLLILFAAIMRIVPHAPNFTPLGAIALFSGVYLSKKWSFIIPLAVMVLTDYFLGFHRTMYYVYASFLLIGLIGMWLQSHKTARNITLAAVSGSVLFFLITNFGVWLGPWYVHNWAGLADCYIKAIPFFRNTLLGDLTYTVVFFGIAELAQYLVARKQKIESVLA